MTFIMPSVCAVRAVELIAELAEHSSWEPSTKSVLDDFGGSSDLKMLWSKLILTRTSVADSLCSQMCGRA